MRTEDYDGIFESAEAYNENLTSTGIRWQMTEEERSAYEKELDVTGDGIMGYLEIPAINVMLPIYHGTNENVLQVRPVYIAPFIVAPVLLLLILSMFVSTGKRTRKKHRSENSAEEKAE